MSRLIVSADVGGTNARFALTSIEDGRVVDLGECVTLSTADYPDFRTAWNAFQDRLSSDPPDEMAIAFAGSVEGGLLRLTNGQWLIQPAMLADQLGLAQLTIVNDLAAVAAAVAELDKHHFAHLCGPDRHIGDEPMTTVVGVGTGLGAAGLLRRSGRAEVIETEGGHIDFAPLDSFEDHLLAELRKGLARVSVERLVSGPGLMNFYHVLGAVEEELCAIDDERQLWEAAINGSDALAGRALERFCLSFGAVAGDLALAHGASAVVIGGGLGLRLAQHLPASGFPGRFVAKGRYEARMAAMPVKILVHPQPGLLGAAASFAKVHS